MSWATSSSTRSSTRSTSGIACSRPVPSSASAPCGLGALRTLRLEKKYVLFGLDANDTTTPLEAGLGWTIKFDKPRFAGKEALERQRAAGPARRIVLIEFETLDFVPPIGAPILVDGDRSRQGHVGRSRIHRGQGVGAGLRRDRCTRTRGRRSWSPAPRARTPEKSTFGRFTIPTAIACGCSE